MLSEMLHTLPHELLAHIGLYLSYQDFAALRLTCQWLHQFVDGQIWGKKALFILSSDNQHLGLPFLQRMTNMTRIKILDETFSRITNKSFRMKKLLMSVPAHVKEVVFQPKITPGKTSNPHVKTLKGIQSLAKTLYEKFDIVIFLYTECGSCSNPDAIPYLFSHQKLFLCAQFRFSTETDPTVDAPVKYWGKIFCKTYQQLMEIIIENGQKTYLAYLLRHEKAHCFEEWPVVAISGTYIIYEDKLSVIQ